MKKLILSLGLAALALSSNAQALKASAPGFAYDNFSSATEFQLVGSTYGIFFYKDTVNLKASYTKDGVDYSDGKISQIKERLGDGKLTYTLTQPYNSYIPLGLTFGKGNTIDIAANPVVKLNVTNSFDSTLYFKVALKDIMGHVIDSKGTEAYRQGNWYMDEMAFKISPANVASNISLSTVNKMAVTFSKTGTSNEVSLNFANAYHANYGTKIADSTSFDFTKLAEVQITVVNPNQVDTDGFHRKAINGAKITLNSISVGSFVNGLNDESSNSTSEEIVSAYDMLGNFVGTGKIKELGLESGKVYIVKSSSQTRKIVMAK